MKRKKEERKKERKKERRKKDERRNDESAKQNISIVMNRYSIEVYQNSSGIT